MPFPIAEMNTGGTYAIIITMNNAVRVYKVAPIYGRIIYVADLGFFLLDEEYRYIFNNKSEAYIFTQKGCNPISAAALLDVAQYLKNTGPRKELEIRDLALFVDKIRKVEVQKNLIKTLQIDPNNAMDDKALVQMLNVGSFDYTVEKMTQKSKPKPSETGLGDKTIDWLNAYFKEDSLASFSPYCSLYFR